MNNLRLIRKLSTNKYHILYSVLLFLTPLIFVNNVNELFEFPKMFFVYFMALLLLYLFITDIILCRVVYKKLPFVVVIYLFVYVISTILSIHIGTSLMGYYSRFNEGLLSVLAFVAIFIVGNSVLTLKSLSAILRISLLNIIPISLFAITQNTEIHALFGFGSSSERVFSTFGQPNWLAQYLVFMLPLCLHLSLTYESENPIKLETPFETSNGIYTFFTKFVLKNLWTLIFVLGFTALWFTYSLSGLLGCLASLILFSCFYWKDITSSLVKVRRMLVIGFFCLFVVVSFPGIILPRIHDALYDVINKLSNVSVVYADTIISTQHKVSDPGFIRLTLWRDAIKLIISSPKVILIGTGPETFPYAFQPFRSVDLNYSSEWNYVFNKPHNYYLEIISETGILGFFSYITLVFFGFRGLPKQYLLGIFGYLITNIFGWPLVSTTLLFWMCVLLGTKHHEKTIN